MEWQTFGFVDNPLQTSPITKTTLKLFTGHVEELRICKSVLTSSNIRIVIEGARGVGTTSFANYLRFNAKTKKSHFTPRTEIKVERGWRLETLLAAIISNFVREIELLPHNKTLITDNRFQAAKALSSRISETYRSFGVDAFSFGANYNKTGTATQPIIVPSPTLGHHLEDLISLIKEFGYKNGVLLQLNNLDIGEIHDQKEIKHLFNSLRDYTQIDGSNWLFVGDLGLRQFIAQHVDRLDDIISYEVRINPLSLSDLATAIRKRVQFYSESKNARLPIDQEVFSYLYQITAGRLRYIFGLLSRLMSRIYLGDLTNNVTLDLAKPMLVQLGKDRVQQSNITAVEEQVLRLLVTTPNATASTISKEINKTSQYAGRILANLAAKGLVLSQKTGKDRNYTPSINAIIAYTEIS